MSETVIACEGYHDRAFWKGWLESLGCRNLGTPQPGKSVATPVLDPWSRRVTGGQFGFHSLHEHFIRIVPCRGISRIIPYLRTRLDDRADRPLKQLLVNVDADINADGTPAAGTTLTAGAIENVLREMDTDMTGAGDQYQLDAGATTVSLIRWEAADAVTPGIPNQQTLERLVCAALAAAYPNRPVQVQKWLDSRPDAPPTSPKEFAWSFMAGWYADQGCEAFYSVLWSVPEIVEELRSRLESSGAWAIVESIAHAQD